MPIQLTPAKLREWAPRANDDYVKAILAGASELKEAGLLDDLQTWACFIGNVGAETGYLTIVRESMRYSSKNLLRVFPKRYPNTVSGRARAKAHARKGEQFIANFNYGFRLGNRKRSNDGFDFRGALLLQATGRDMAMAAQKHTGIPFHDDPKQFNRIENAIPIAIFTWKNFHGDLGKYASRGGLAGFRMCCNGINRGNPRSKYNPIGWSHRQAAYRKALKVWADDNDNDNAMADGMLVEGESGDHIKALQEMLVRYGYNQCGKADGEFGFNTKVAVKAFQDANGLTEDGKWGPKCIELVKSGDVIPRPISAERAGLSDPETEPDSKEAAQVVKEQVAQVSRKAKTAKRGVQGSKLMQWLGVGTLGAGSMAEAQSSMGKIKGTADAALQLKMTALENWHLLAILAGVIAIGVVGRFAFNKIWTRQAEDHADMKVPGAGK